MMRRALELSALFLAGLLLCASARAQQAAPGAAQPSDDTVGQSDTDLAKKIQNPIGDLYSFPFQSNTNFGFGPHNGTQEIVNIQPVIPLHVTPDWNIITRTILPLVWTPDLSPAPSVPFGTAPTTFSAFLSPAKPTNGWLWGVGPVLQVPTISSSSLGSNVWGGGPTAVLVYMNGPWVVGVLANNVWSFGGTKGSGGNSYNNFLTQPFVNYNLGSGWYVTSSPLITANWEAAGTKWTVPVGGGAGRVFKVGKLPINLSLSAYYNIVKPLYGADWQLRTQLTLIF
ncbi:MAG: hypothetical protein ACLQDM_15280 [Bradyrhizobium sp.]